uniref:Methyltransferase domain-containing protein n=1 Tax=Eiseniibacteriota bacterium TaxID=2212470 RepID=A0A832I463_UNCEI
MDAPRHPAPDAGPARGPRPPLVPIERLDAVPDAALAALAAAAARHGFDSEALAEAERLLPAMAEAMRGPAIRAALAARTEPRMALARLFAYDDAVPAERVQALLGAETTGALAAAGLLEPAPAPRGAGWRARGRLMPFEGLLVWSDRPDAGDAAVMGPGATTQGAARLLPARIAGDVLDVGCGAGSFALLAARRGARRATGVDIAPRAVALARFNARLNRVTAEFAAGDLLAPVAGRAFDLIVAQPPYVVEPEGLGGVTYLHGGARGDAVLRRLLAGLGRALAPGGRALVVADLWLPRGATLHETLRAHLGDPALDLVTLAAPGLSAPIQAAAYASLDDPSLGERYAWAVARYLEHFAALDAQPVHAALVVRRRAHAAPEALTVTVPVAGFAGRDGRDVDQLLAAMDLLGAPDATLLRAALRASRHATWVEERRAPDPAAEARYSVRFERGALARDRELSGSSLVLAATLDAAPSVAAAVERWAAEVGASPAEVRDEVLAFARDGLASGLLVPAS